MPRPHPIELRVRVVEAYNDGEGSYKEIGERFAVGEASVNRWVNRERRTGSVAADPMGGSRGRKITGPAGAYMQELVEDEPNWTTTELRDQLEEAYGISVTRHTVGRELAKRGFTFKRGPSGRHVLLRPRW